MVQLSPLPALPPVAAPRGVAIASGGATGFATVLGALQAAATPVPGVVPRIAASLAPPAGQPGNARQEIAVPGNVLPERRGSDAQAEGEDVESGLSTDTEADADADGASAPLDPAIAWLAPLLVPDAPDALPIAPGTASPSANVIPLDFRQAATSGGVAVAPETADATPRTDGDAPDAPRTPDAAAAPDGFRLPAGMVATRPTPLARPDAAPAPVANPALADATAQPARTTEMPGKAQLPAQSKTSVEPADAPGRAVDARTAPATVPPAAIPTTPVITPPVAAAAAPLAAATTDPVTRTLARRDPVDPAAPTGVAAAAALAGQVASPLAVAATASAQQGALDMTDSGWMESMIDRIETMRDESGVRDTRIRLAPNALGTVELAIRHEGDRIHVHFAADNAQARQMLTDAQPQLAEIAHERGLKLGQSSVDAGTANGGQHRDPAPESLSRRPIAAPVEAPDASAADTRIA